MLTMMPRQVPRSRRPRGRPPLLQGKELGRALDCVRYQQTNDVTIEQTAVAFGVHWTTVYRWNRALRGETS